MKRIFIAFLILLASKSYGQLLSCNSTEYAGTAPISIDGSIADWEAILGASGTDPIFPFGATSLAYDTYGVNDPDHAESKIDIRVKTVAHDATNVYFYFRRLDNSNSALKAFYFLDTNVDGLISTGEPVIVINFNSQNVQKLSLGYYVSFNPAGDPIGEPLPGNNCKIDGYPMKGTIDEVIHSNKVDLLPGEIFDAEVTEDGFGVELAIPWRLISAYKHFAYHLTLQKGGGSYNPDAPSDNAGNCLTNLSVVGSPDIDVSNINVTTLTEGLSFRIDLDFTNLTSTALIVDASTFISFKNIIQNDNLPIDATQFTVTVNGDPYPYYDGTFINQPIRYSNLLLPGAGVFELDPLATSTVSIVISFPPNFSVESAVVEIQPLARFKLETLCFPNVGGGGKPTNPIGVPVGDEPTTRSLPGYQYDKESPNKTWDRIQVYPNPTSGRATLVLPGGSGMYDIELTDYTGRLIRKWRNVSGGNFYFETTTKGFYLLSIKSPNGLKYIRKLIVQ